ncbi:MAG: type VI secretion system tube protein Hcp [Myxococcaceae bacterium]|nr:type VI secretion system tube protein Hcp [Myxococcaceae bacterium]
MRRLGLGAVLALLLPAAALAQPVLVTLPGVTPARGDFVVSGFAQVSGRSVAANKVKVSSFTFTQNDDSLLPQLLKALGQKTRFASLEVVVQANVNGRVVPAFRWTLRDVLITSVTASETNSGPGTTQWSVTCSTFDFASFLGTGTRVLNVGVE